MKSTRSWRKIFLSVLIATNLLFVSTGCAAADAPHTERQMVGTWIGRRGLSIVLKSDGTALVANLPSVIVARVTDHNAAGVTNGSAEWSLEQFAGQQVLQFYAIKLIPTKYSRGGWYANFRPGKPESIYFVIGDPDSGNFIYLEKKN